uniref:Uncharacterized protein n=1 Tax=Manihot esculenta TaxID=3983 RepID=A0A2C9V4F6_MANES
MEHVFQEPVRVSCLCFLMNGARYRVQVNCYSPLDELNGTRYSWLYAGQI